MSLETALELVTRGDHAAFDHIYEQTKDYLLGVAERILKRRDLAEDVLHDVYITVWSSSHQYDASLAKPMTWLITMVRNRSIDRLRSRTHEVYESQLGTAADVDSNCEQHAADAATCADPGELAFDGQRVNLLMGHLSPRHRQCLALAYYQGMTHSEVAERLNAPLGSVKVWIRRGLAQLQRNV